MGGGPSPPAILQARTGTTRPAFLLRIALPGTAGYRCPVSLRRGVARLARARSLPVAARGDRADRSPDGHWQLLLAAGEPAGRKSAASRARARQRAGRTALSGRAGPGGRGSAAAARGRKAGG